MLDVDTSKKEWLKEVGLGALGLATAIALAWHIPDNLIFCGAAIALTFNAIFFLNRQLPKEARHGDARCPREVAAYMRSSSLASIRRQYRYYALVSDLVLIYFIVDHFMI